LAEYRLVNHDYFRTLRIPLKQGRGFSPQDDGRGPPVAVVNETFARRYFPHAKALGQRISFHGGSANACEIVGVVGDEKFFGLGRDHPPIVYHPYFQECWHQMWLLTRTASDPLNLAGPVRQQIWAVDPEQPIAKVRTMRQMVGDSLSVQRFATVLLLGFAAVGLALAALGIYGVLAYAVSQRSHEIGVRLALGAKVNDILRMVVRQGLRLAGLGLALGLGVSLALSRLLQGLLDEMSASDPATFGAVLVVLGAVALLACWLPARRASRLDPVVVLRCE
jgi:putative ABC transport system permease protein